MIGLLGAVALGCSSCASGPEHLAAKPVDHTVAVVRTLPVASTTGPVSSSTTTTTNPKTDSSSAGAPAQSSRPSLSPSPEPSPAITTTTTDPFPPGCAWSDFATKVGTDQSAYSPGQPVQITLEFENAGPACTVTATGYACPVVNVDDASGSLVWSSAAPVSTGCPSTFTGPTVLAANWSQSFSFSWAQGSCTPGQVEACPGLQVPAGSYQVTGMSGGGSGQIPAGAPVAVDLVAAGT